MKSIVSYLVKAGLLTMACASSAAYTVENNPAPMSFVRAIESDTQLVQNQGLAIYHPTLGFVNYETTLCGAKEKTEQAFKQLVTSVCSEQQGRVESNWCIDTKSNAPLFNAELGSFVMTCQDGEYSSIIHVLEALPSVKISSEQRNNWLQVATSFGYL
ncbi:hypothetical protein [Photobacterium leiognathi]|uniref:hypothetical protein n=1 Tax=Photobacterium leiognathi TaxID=553611 RepID=UPI002982881F|nr:hypothetical protein [Photobacterium leiognathi]